MVSPSHDAAQSGSSVPPEYDRTVVAKVILEEVVELHPKCLSTENLALRVITRPADKRALETASQAIKDLTESGLLQEQANGLARPTRAALHAVALLT